MCGQGKYCFARYGLKGSHPVVGFKEFVSRSAGSIIKVLFSPGSVSTNGASINSNAGWFVDLIEFCERVLWNRCKPAESHQWSHLE